MIDVFLRPKHCLRFYIAGATALWLSAAAHALETTRVVSFARQVQPILAEHCYRCHGPDANAREADLRLDVEQTFRDDRNVNYLFNSQHPEESEILHRIMAADEDVRMPPPSTGDQLTSREIDTIRQWIAEGATWEKHWAFIKPVRVPVPEVGHSEWPLNAIDAFILRRLEREGLEPSAGADKETLVRRVTLDLTGLPPTPTEVDRFIADNRPGAYARLVDRLLASPRYGEQMASVWLDAARYADTYGYQDDGETSMWRWRDWVIDAFNANMPFDQFTIEQLAGDLLPKPTFEQRMATGFNRNHRQNSEGGAIPEEFRTENVIDRVVTTGTVWLGLTLGCARCHDHKFDPITQEEFYQLYAFFNNVPEDGRARKEGNTPPLMSAPTTEQLNQQQALERQLQLVRAQQADLEPQLDAALAEWEASIDPTSLADWKVVSHDLEVHHTFDDTLESANPEKHIGSFQGGHASFTAGPLGQAALLDGKTIADLGDVGSFSSDDRVSITLWVKPTASSGVVLSKIEYPDDPHEEGYTVLLQDGKLRVHLTSQWQDDAIRVQTQTKLPMNRWTHLVVTYDGLQFAKGIRVYFNGKPQPMDTEFDTLYQGFANDGSLRLGTAGDSNNQFRGAIDDLRIYKELLTSDEINLLRVQEPIAEILRESKVQRTAAQKNKLRRYYLEHQAAAAFVQADQQVHDLERKLVDLRRTFPTLMVMEEMPEPRNTHVLVRGQYDAPGKGVQPGVPSVLPGLPEAAAPNRLTLARWLVDPDNPLTARVAVNRLWQMSFDCGLISTAEDFGIQGERPSHPDLLDWLATELVRQHWDLRSLRRMIVTSATYRQQSQVSHELLQIDPDNRLLARGPRFRLSAEEIRDSALVASGLFVEKQGGPSVKPYQPKGLWEELSDEEYVQDHGDKLYRRSLYLFWKRTVTHPLMTAFDAPSREVCTVREERTDTPMQALALMNEEGMVEAARVLAERVLNAPQQTEQDRLSDAFRATTCRHPTAAELSLLQQLLQSHVEHFAQHPQKAELLATVGEYPRTPQLDPVEVAAYTSVANLLLNSDEVVTQH